MLTDLEFKSYLEKSNRSYGCSIKIAMKFQKSKCLSQYVKAYHPILYRAHGGLLLENVSQIISSKQFFCFDQLAKFLLFLHSLFCLGVWPPITLIRILEIKIRYIMLKIFHYESSHEPKTVLKILSSIVFTNSICPILLAVTN